jgi:hypothetical protein
MGKVAIKLATEPGVLGSVSEDRETEWKEDIEEDGAWPEGREYGRGGYLCACSTVNESFRRGAVKEGLRGGSFGGALPGFGRGGEPRVMRGLEEGPSSTTQSLRSMSEEATVVEDIKGCSPPTMADLYAVADFCLIPIGTASSSVCTRFVLSCPFSLPKGRR